MIHTVGNRKPLLWIPIGVFIFSTLLLVLAIINFWFGQSRGGIMLFCEQAREGFVKQPSNSYSNIGFVIAGLVVAWQMFRNRFDGKNLMTRTYFFPILFASVLILLGIGSFAMHATNTRWGGFFDLFSMFLFSAFVFSYGLMRLFGFSRGVFLVLYIVNVTFCSWLHMSPYNELGVMLKASEFCFITHLVVAVIAEATLKFSKKSIIDIKWGLMGVGTLIVAFIIWNLSRTQDSWFCNPDSLIQGHAMWHLLDALAAYFVFIFYVSETKGE